MLLSRTKFPDYHVFRDTCQNGLSTIRPFHPQCERSETRWNFSSGWPPSYWAFGRMRALLALEYALALQPKRVLEVAAGDGALCACLAQHGCDVTANDLRAESLCDALKAFQNADSVRVLGGNLFDLSVETTGTFDLVVACEIIEHVAHTTDFLKQLYRFVKPGGHVLVTTPNGRYFRNKLPTHSQVDDFAALESKQFKPDADGHLFLLTSDELCALAQTAGFATKEICVWGTPLLTGHVKFALLSHQKAIWPAYRAEVVIQTAPAGIRERACTAISAILARL